MSTIIGNRPQGLVSLLGLRDMGGVPAELLAQVQPGVDLTDFFTVDREGLAQANTYSAVGNNLGFTVPPGELWRVHAFGFRSGPLGAGERIGVGTGFTPQLTGVFVPTSDPVITTQVGSICMGTAQGPIWLGAGGALLVQVTDITTSSSITVTTTAVITRLRV